jgi:hypothetical protein
MSSCYSAQCSLVQDFGLHNMTVKKHVLPTYRVVCRLWTTFKISQHLTKILIHVHKHKKLSRGTTHNQAGRPKLRWSDCTENDLKSTGVKGWRKKLQDRLYGLSFWECHSLNCKDHVPMRRRKKMKKMKTMMMMMMMNIRPHRPRWKRCPPAPSQTYAHFTYHHARTHFSKQLKDLYKTSQSVYWLGQGLTAGTRHLPFIQNVQTGSRAYPASCSMGTRDEKRQGVKLTDHTPAFSARLRMNAAIPLHRHRHSGVQRDIYLQIKFQVRFATRAKW